VAEKTTVTVTVTVRVGEANDGTDATRTVQYLSESPLHHAYTAHEGIAEATSSVMAMLVGRFGDIRNPTVPPLAR